MSEEKADYNPADKMIKLSGKAYLQVADRIVWFRNDYPEGTIETSIVSIDEQEGSAIFRARITTGNGGIAEATGDETRKDFPQGWIGKAETKAVGRALGYLGYGTAAAGFEEGHRPVDAPQELRTPRSNQRKDERNTPPPVAQAAPAANGKPAEQYGPGIEAGDFEVIMADAAKLNARGAPFKEVRDSLKQHYDDATEAQYDRMQVFLKAIAPKKAQPPASIAG